MSTAPSTPLITGASAGIGRDLARLFAADGHNLVLVARRAEALRALADELAREHRIQAATIAVDLAKPDAPARIQSELSRAGTSIDVVVNNAGFALQGPVPELPLQRHLAMTQIN